MTDLVIPGIAVIARAGRPEPARQDDGNRWMDGRCFLFCGFAYKRVLWIGPATIATVQAPLFACAACIQILYDRVWETLLLGDAPVKERPAEPVEAVEAVRRAHRRPGLIERYVRPRGRDR